jgi:long-chain acyl-CoA synthetase
VASFNHADSERKPGTIGQPVMDVEMKVVDDRAERWSKGRSAR